MLRKVVLCISLILLIRRSVIYVALLLVLGALLALAVALKKKGARASGSRGGAESK